MRGFFVDESLNLVLIFILQSFKADNIVPQKILIKIIPIGIVGGDIQSLKANEVVPRFDLVGFKKMVSNNFEIGV